MFSSVGKTNIENDARRLRALLTGGAAGFVTAADLAKIIRYSGGAVTFYPATAAGLTDALADAVSGDRVILPPGTYASAYTVPAGVAVIGDPTCVITGQITLGADSLLDGLAVTVSGSSGGNLIGVSGPASGIAYLRGTRIAVGNSGSGAGYGVELRGGRLETTGNDVVSDNYPIYASGSGTLADVGSQWSNNDAPVSDVLQNQEFVASINGWTTGYDSGGWDYSNGWLASYAGKNGICRLGFTAGGFGGYAYARQYVTLQPGVYRLTSLVQSTQYGQCGIYINGQWAWDSNIGWETLSITTSIAAAGEYYVELRVGVSGFPPSPGLGYFDFIRLELANASDISNVPYAVSLTGAEIDGPQAGIVSPWSDRSAWDVNAYPARHASDIWSGSAVRHLPEPAASGKIPIDQGTVWQAHPVSGDATLSNLGALTLAVGAVTLPKLASGSALSVLGVSGSATATPGWIQAAADGQVFRRVAGVLGFGAIDLTSSSAVSGVLPIANGGTGGSGIAPGQIVYGSAGSALTSGSGLQYDGDTLALGVAPSSTYKMRVYDAQSDIAGSRYALYVQGVYAYTAANTQQARGIISDLQLNPATGITLATASRYYSNLAISRNIGAGTVAHLYGYRDSLQLSGGGRVTNYYGLYASAPSISSGSVANHYGLYVEALTSGSVANYGIYQAGASTPNSLAGQLQLPTSGSAGGLLLGGDVQLYRDAADSLRINDQVSIYRNMTAGGPFLYCEDTEISSGSGYFSFSEGTGAVGAFAPQFTGASVGLNGLGIIFNGRIPAANDTAAATFGGILLVSQLGASGSASNAHTLNVRNYTTPQLIVTALGDVRIGAASSGSATAHPQLVIAQTSGSANRAGSVSGAAGFYVRPTATAEMWVFDAAGNETQLSKHADPDEAALHGLTVPEDDPYPQVSCEENSYLGVTAYTYRHYKTNVQQRVVVDWPPDQRRDWDADQAQHAAQRAAEIAEWEQAPPAVRGDRPAEYVYKPMPGWMARRLAAKKAAGR